LGGVTFESNSYKYCGWCWCFEWFDA